jgi:hypothetical protein
VWILFVVCGRQRYYVDVVMTVLGRSEATRTPGPDRPQTEPAAVAVR